MLDLPFSGERARKCRQQLEEMRPQGVSHKMPSGGGARHKIADFSGSKSADCYDDASTHLPSHISIVGDDDDGDADANMAFSLESAAFYNLNAENRLAEHADCSKKARLAVEVIGHEVACDLHDNEFVQYRVRASHYRGARVVFSHEMLIRFSQFRELHEGLRREKWVGLPCLPPRYTLGLLEPTAEWFREERMRGLQQYFDHLLKEVLDLKLSTAFHNFLNAEDRPTENADCNEKATLALLGPIAE